MNKKFIFIVIIATTLYFVGIQEAISRPQYFSAFEKTYPEVVGKDIDKCIMCHRENPENGDDARNPYGMDYGRTKNFASIESLDSDKDGYSNIVEINNLNFPMNAQDYPSVTPVQTPAVTNLEKTSGFEIIIGIFMLLIIYRRRNSYK